MTAEENPGGSGTGALEALERFVVDNDDLLELESLIGRFNIFDALGIMDYEIRHSNFLAFLLNPAESHGQGQLFLKAVLMDLLKQAPPKLRPLSPIELDGTDLRGVEVRREWEHIDLLILCKEPRFSVVIENKIWAEEGLEQLTDYEEVMQQKYPDSRPLFVYLTRSRDMPSSDNWMPYSHADIYVVLKRVRETYSKGIGDDVLIFLDHCLNLIGTRFMNDSKESKRIDELCQRIYTTHRQALDLIRARVRSSPSGVLAEAKSVFEEDLRWDIEVYPSRLCFLPKSREGWRPQSLLKDSWFMWAQAESYNGKLTFYIWVYLAPFKDFAQEIVTKLFAEMPALGFKNPRTRNKEPVQDKAFQITGPKTIFEWKEDEKPDAKEVREAVKKALDDLYPKLEKLEPALKQLCNLPASAK